MTDENTPDSPDAGVPDTTPTEPVAAVEPVELADQQPIDDGSTPDVTQAAPASGGTSTRTILEIVGGVVAAGLIIVAGAGGFAAGLVVGDGEGRGHGDDHWSEHQADGPMGKGFGDMEGRGFGDMEGRGFGDDDGMRGQGKQGERGMGGHSHDDEGMGRGFGDGDMDRRGMEGFGPGQEMDGDQLRQGMEDMMRQFMDEFGEGMDLEDMLPGPMGNGQGDGPGQQSQG